MNLGKLVFVPTPKAKRERREDIIKEVYQLVGRLAEKEIYVPAPQIVDLIEKEAK